MATESAKATLTPREVQVVRRVAEGKRAKEIGRELGISTKTVEAHKYHAMTKLGVHDSVTLTLRAMRLGLVAAGPPGGGGAA